MTSLLTVVGWTLIHFGWQACAIAVPVAVLLRVTSRRAANVRYMIACLGLVAMLVAPIFTARLLLGDGDQVHSVDGTEASAAVVSPESSSASSERAVRRSVSAARLSGSLPDPDRLASGVTLVWFACVVLLLGRMAGGWLAVRRLHRKALAADASTWQVACRRIAFRLGLPAAAHVVESSLVDVPTVIGWLRPAVLLPVAALATLTPQQVEAILAHELAHIRRHDYLVNVVQTFAETLLFYHPAVWWVSKRIRVEREHCCDDIAVAVCGDAVSYAEALAVLEQSKSQGMRMAVAATGGALLDRVRRILGVPTSANDLTRSSSWVVTLVLTLVFSAGAGGVRQLLSSSRTPAAGVEAVPGTGSDPGSDPVPGLVTGSVPGLVPGSEAALVTAAAAPTNAGHMAEPPQPPAEPASPPAPPASFGRFVPSAPAAPAQPPPAAPLPPPAPPHPAARQTSPAPPPPPTPLAPPVPTPPAAPAAPPVPPSRGFSVNGSDGISRWTWSDDDVRLEVTLQGDVTFKDDLSDVDSISDGGWLRIRDWSRLVPRTIEIRAENGKLTHRYYVAGVSRGWDAEAAQRLREELPTLVRRSGLGAESRVRSILERNGLAGVLDEIGLLESDYARRLYFTALIDRARPDAQTITRIMAKMDGVRSDYDRSQVLQRIAARVSLDQRAAAEYVRTASPIKSDYERRRVLSALLAARPLPAGAAGLVLRSAADMRSDYDRGEVLLVALAQEAAPDADALFATVGRMTSSYEQRRVLDELADRASLTLELKRGLLIAASTMKSDFDRASVLIAYVNRHGGDTTVRQPLFAAVNGMTSDYEKRCVLTTIASKSASDVDIQRAAFDSVSLMHSDYDRAEILLAFLRAFGVDSASRSAFVAAAERMSSSHEQNRVLAALVRSERR